MAGLLVSVRDAEEAESAVAGGASVIDIKEPSRGPLGRADRAIWESVLDRVPPPLPVSAALGELGEWSNLEAEAESLADSRLSFVKMGLSQAGPDWISRWRELRRLLTPGGSPRWVAVVYLDWQVALAPPPEQVVSAALEAGAAGLLVDLWSKSEGQGGHVEANLPARGWLQRAREGGLFVCLAGRLDAAAIYRLNPLGPDLFGVRGAACAGGDRAGVIERARVEVLALAAAGSALLPGGIAGSLAGGTASLSRSRRDEGADVRETFGD